MARSPSKPECHDDEALDLSASIEQLTRQINVLTGAVDELCDEVQWLSREWRKGREPTPLPPVLRSLPADPRSDDWQINRVPPEEMAQMRQQVAPATATPQREEAALSRSSEAAITQLCREMAEVRQVLAAQILIGAEAYEFGEVYDWIIEWASQEFDQELLAESLGIPPAAAPAPAPVKTVVPRPAEHQPALFGGDPDAE